MTVKKCRGTELFAADVEDIEGIGVVSAVFDEVSFSATLRKRQADDFGQGELLPPIQSAS